jgi:CHAD domain-containing protein
MASRSNVAETLRTIAREILTAADRAITDQTLSEAIAVHEFRKKMKRWRALLRLLEPYLARKDRALRIEARDFARSLAGPRDAQSALDAFDDAFKHSTRLPRRLLQAVRERLEHARREAERAVLTAEMRRTISKALRTAGRAVDRWPLQRLKAADIADELTRTYRRVRRRLPNDWHDATPDDLHRMRQRIIELRYQLELLETIFPERGEPRIDDLQKLRDRLGRFQDLALLKNLTGPKGLLVPWRSRLTPVIADRQAVHLAAAARLGERLFAERPKTFRRRLRSARNGAGSN